MDADELPVPRVKLGSQGLEVSKLGFGCTSLTGMYSAPLTDEDGISILKNAFSKGVTFFDTADVYASHSNEILVGKALKQLPREKVQIATKFGIVMAASGMAANGKPEYVRRSCEGSLNRLGLDYIDLYYQHRVDISTPIEETMSELKKLVEEGKIKYIGLSEASPDTIRRAHAVHPITALQMEWSLWTRDIEDEIIPLCRENLDKNKAIYVRIESLAKKHGCSPSQLALAWVLHQGDDVVPIPGTGKIRNLEENIGSLKVRLSEEELKEVTDAVQLEDVAGISTYESMKNLSWKFASTPPKNN
ncbi:Probable aldo-keto reductase 1 [Linum grandiflorum]